MKLRNKKTGEIGIAVFKQYPEYEYLSYIALHFGDKYYHFETMDEFAETFEDYTPAEPLIKDEKVRKAVRAWAEANDYFEVLYDKEKDCIYSPYGSDNTDTGVSISFDDIHVFDKLEHRKLYLIDELCGEEEE